MAKSRQYSRARRILLQLTLGLVLTGMTGLAAYISHKESVQLRVMFGPPRKIGSLMIEGPAHWTRGDVEPTPGVVFTEPLSSHKSREIIIEQGTAPRGVSARDYLISRVEAGPNMRTMPFTLMGETGVVANVGPYQTAYGENVKPGIYAAVIFKDGFAVVIRISSQAVFGRSNEELFDRITKNMTRLKTDAEVI